jgi:hypothetical protein
MVQHFHCKGSSSVTPSIPEDRIRTFLNGVSIEFHYEVSFKGFKYKSGHYPRFDFYLPTISTVIEYDGKEAHSTKQAKKNDAIKNAWCKANGIRMVRLNAKHYAKLEYHVFKLLNYKPAKVAKSATPAKMKEPKLSKTEIQAIKDRISGKKPRQPLGLVLPKGMTEAEYMARKRAKNQG